MRLATMALYVAALCCSHVQTLSASTTGGLGGNNWSATDRLIHAMLTRNDAVAYDALNDGADVDALYVPSLCEYLTREWKFLQERH